MPGSSVPIRRPRVWAVVVLLAVLGGAIASLAITVPAPSAYYTVDAEKTEPTADATPFSELSDRAQRAFRADLREETIRLDSPPDLGHDSVVEYQEEYYLVRVGVADPGTPTLHLVGIFGGAGLVGTATLGALVLLGLAARDRIAGIPG